MAINSNNASSGYNGDNTLKKAGQIIEFTPELVEEYIKCQDDPIYFIENYMKIVQLGKGEVNFTLRDYQRQMVESMHRNRYTVVATSRQAGKCLQKKSVIKVRNKTTGLIQELSIGEFYEKCK